MSSSRGVPGWGLLASPVLLSLIVIAPSGQAQTAPVASDGIHTLALSPEDTFLDLNETRYSSDTTLATYTWPDHQPASAILMKFDLAALPAGAVVQQATLQLALVESDSGAESTYAVTAHKLLGKNPVIAQATGLAASDAAAWSPSTCCDNGVPLAQADISSAYDRRAIDKLPGYKAWTLTRMVEEWRADPATNFGLLLNADASMPADRYRLFASMESPDAALRPVLSIAYTVAASTLDLAPQDTYLNLDASNYSTSARLATYTWPDQRAANAILLKFDFSTLPAGAVLQDASLHLALVASDAAPENTYAVAAHKVIRKNPDIARATGYTTNGATAWTANACCYNGVPLAQADVAPALDTRAIDKTPGVKVWTLTRMVQEWLADPATNFGVLLNADTTKLADRYRYFASMEDPNVALRPVLRLAYSVPTDRLTFSPQDTFLNINATNYSTNTRLATYTWPQERPANAIVMKFDLSGVPAGAVVQEATVHLALMDSDAKPEATYAVTAHKLLGRNPVIASATGYTADGVTPWTANACCNNGVPLAQADISPAYDAREIDKARGYKVWTVTPIVREWLANPAANLGLVINPDTSRRRSGRSRGSELRDRYRYFASMEEPDTRMRPFLRVAYDVLPGGDITPPSVALTAPAAGATVLGTVPVAASATDDVGVAGVQFKLDGANIGAEDAISPYSVAWDTASAATGSHTLTAVARDAAGNLSTSAGVSVTVTRDTTSPSVSITAPGAGASVSGTIPVAASASDNVAVAGVQFKRNGLNLGAEDTTWPYSVSWSTTGVTNGSHTLSALARDTTGNVTTSSLVTVTVANDSTPPSVSITEPAGGATASGTVAVAASASDNVAVAGVQFKLDGANLGAEDTTSPYSVSWNTTTAIDGAHTLTASARDGAGNATTSAVVNVTVANGTVMTLAPQDTYLGLDTTNYSTSTQLNTYTWPDNRVANAIVLKFDVSALPAGAVVGEATLQLALVASDTAVESTYTVTAHKVVGKNPVITGATGYTADGVTAWTPNTCCSNNVPLAQADISAAYDTRAVDKAPGYKSWVVTAMVQEWIANPTTNFGLLLNSDASKLRDRYRFFASAEHADPSLRPLLRIAYSLVPDVTPPVISALLASGVTASGATITWTTNEPSDSQVEYGTTTAYGSLNALNGSRVIAHVSNLGGLAPNTLYHFRVRSRDLAGNLVVSGDATFTTVALDLTPPTVSITAPAAGATVVGTVPVTASASDNVGVVGVQFRLDGANLGAEDTASPYSTSWDTTTAGNGAHTLTAVARDAYGNQTTSAAATVTVGNTAGTVIFESNWDTATGNTNNAITDGGRWTGYTQFDSPPTPIMSVVTGGPNGHNALRVQQRGPLYPAHVWKTNFTAQSSDYYLRYYFKTDDTSSSGDHIVTVASGIAVPPGDNLTFLRKYGGATDWTMTLSAYGCGDLFGYPMRHWSPGPRLANGQWFRLEYHVDFIDTTHMRVHPRIYNAAGTLLYDDDDFRQENWGASSPWNGRNDWTLASFYAAGYSFCVDPVVMNDFGMGNNGQAGASDTGRYWYYAGAQLRTDGWPGPLGGISGDTTSPTASMTAPASGATVSGAATTVSATASDDVGVAGVQFKLDGANLGAEDATAPYAVSWNTSGATNGNHTLTAVARDAAGNSTASSGVTVTVSNAAPGGIAALYPGDVGIENHSAVVFVEKFEEATLTDLFNRWTDILNGAAMSFSSDVPAGSAGTRSLDIPWVGGGVNNGGQLYKQLSPGVDDTLYVRYYIKYPTTGRYRHDGVWMGGYNPPLLWPDPKAGIKPVGDDRFAASAEQTDDTTHLDHYNYWMDMHRAADGNYWGNTLLNDPNVKVRVGEWVCLEQMITLNNPVTASNGQHAIWIDGVKVSHLGQGFPNGYWSGGNFTQNPAGSPFEGFRWRSDPNLKLNWVWLQNYSPDDPPGFVGSMKFDHLVVAREYVGCLTP